MCWALGWVLLMVLPSFSAHLGVGCHYPHVTNKKTKIQKGQVLAQGHTGTELWLWSFWMINMVLSLLWVLPSSDIKVPGYPPPSSSPISRLSHESPVDSCPRLTALSVGQGELVRGPERNEILRLFQAGPFMEHVHFTGRETKGGDLLVVPECL